eukprot:maker-scaffold14_size734282-snap-gene-0.9 protein:Tk11272 transcript:maker-scaffold14_size734282-snap-gene-0.9-mRNA-1 annotation:"hypothetical protein AE07_02379"
MPIQLNKRVLEIMPQLCVVARGTSEKRLKNIIMEPACIIYRLKSGRIVYQQEVESSSSNNLCKQNPKYLKDVIQTNFGEEGTAMCCRQDGCNKDIPRDFEIQSRMLFLEDFDRVQGPYMKADYTAGASGIASGAGLFPLISLACHLFRLAWSEVDKLIFKELCEDAGDGLCLVGVWLGEDPSELNDEARLCKLKEWDNLEFIKESRVTWKGGIADASHHEILLHAAFQVGVVALALTDLVLQPVLDLVFALEVVTQLSNLLALPLQLIGDHLVLELCGKLTCG